MYVYVLRLTWKARKIYTSKGTSQLFFTFSVIGPITHGGLLQYGKSSAVTYHIYQLYTYDVYAVSLGVKYTFSPFTLVVG